MWTSDSFSRNQNKYVFRNQTVTCYWSPLPSCEHCVPVIIPAIAPLLFDWLIQTPEARTRPLWLSRGGPLSVVLTSASKQPLSGPRKLLNLSHCILKMTSVLSQHTHLRTRARTQHTHVLIKALRLRSEVSPKCNQLLLFCYCMFIWCILKHCLELRIQHPGRTNNIIW